MGYTKIDRGKRAALPVAKLINIFLKIILILSIQMLG